ncbi:MAG: ATP-binding protein [Flavobacteriales bacterium]|nr:ATP-binding protein [Flavobacteriales bacterium]
MPKRFMNWSSGKDSALCLHRLIESGNAPELLLTTISKEEQRIGMHGTRRELLEEQAAAIGIPLQITELSASTDHEAYNKLMYDTCMQLKSEGFDTAVFGDIFLEDLRNYRETQLNEVGINGEFPLWKNDTKTLIKEFVNSGLKSVIVAALQEHFDEDFVGTEIDSSFISKLPEEVDPCGEYGEFHSFCYNGPIFKQEITFERGDKVLKYYNKPKESKSEIRRPEPVEGRDQKSETLDSNEESRTRSSDSDSRLGFYYLDLIPNN